MHAYITKDARKELEVSLNAVGNVRQLVLLAASQTRMLNRGEGVLILGIPELIPEVRSYLARFGMTHFDLSAYEACAHESLRLGEDEILEEFFKPFYRQTPGLWHAWFTPRWKTLPGVEARRRFLAEQQCTVSDYQHRP